MVGKREYGLKCNAKKTKQPILNKIAMNIPIFHA